MILATRVQFFLLLLWHFPQVSRFCLTFLCMHLLHLLWAARLRRVPLSTVPKVLLASFRQVNDRDPYGPKGFQLWRICSNQGLPLSWGKWWHRSRSRLPNSQWILQMKQKGWSKKSMRLQSSVYLEECGLAQNMSNQLELCLSCEPRAVCFPIILLDCPLNVPVCPPLLQSFLSRN